MKTVGQEVKEALGGEIINDALADKITLMFNEAVDKQVDARIGIAVESELEKMDDSHAEMLQKLMENMDRDHTQKMKTLIEAMDKNYSQKLITVAEKYENEMKVSAKELKESMTKRISDFLELYLEKTFPKDMLVEACNNARATHLLAKIRDVVGLDATYINSSVKEAIKEAHNRITELEESVKEKEDRIRVLHEQTDASKAQLMLEHKTAGLAPEKRDYIKSRFAGKSAKDIEANFDFVLEMYNKTERDRRESERNRSITESTTIVSKFDRPKVKQSITEKVEDRLQKSPQDGDVAMCLDGLNDFM